MADAGEGLKVREYRRRTYMFGSYFVGLRDAERQLLKHAADIAPTIDIACEALGISKAFFHLRAKILGGVRKDEPRLEPPPKEQIDKYEARREKNRVAKAKIKHAKRSVSNPAPGTPGDADPQPADQSADGEVLRTHRARKRRASGDGDRLVDGDRDERE